MRLGQRWRMEALDVQPEAVDAMIHTRHQALPVSQARWERMVELAQQRPANYPAATLANEAGRARSRRTTPA